MSCRQPQWCQRYREWRSHWACGHWGWQRVIVFWTAWTTQSLRGSHYRTAVSLISSSAYYGPVCLSVTHLTLWHGSIQVSAQTGQLLNAHDLKQKKEQDGQAKSRTGKKWPTAAASLMLIACLVVDIMQHCIFAFADTLTLQQGQCHQNKYAHIWHA